VRFVAGVVEQERLEGVCGVAAVVFDRSGHQLGEKIVAVGGPAKGIDQVAHELIAARILLTFEKAAALAVAVLDPHVIVLQVVFFGFEVVVDGKDDGAARPE
jgi:hypothetical protein